MKKVITREMTAEEQEKFESYYEKKYGFETYQEDIAKYLNNKLEKYNIPSHVIAEAVEYLTFKFINTYHFEKYKEAKRGHQAIKRQAEMVRRTEV